MKRGKWFGFSNSMGPQEELCVPAGLIMNPAGTYSHPARKKRNFLCCWKLI